GVRRTEQFPGDSAKHALQYPAGGSTRQPADLTGAPALPLAGRNGGALAHVLSRQRELANGVGWRPMPVGGELREKGLVLHGRPLGSGGFHGCCRGSWYGDQR